jgi:hypothetical protein
MWTLPWFIYVCVYIYIYIYITRIVYNLLFRPTIVKYVCINNNAYFIKYSDVFQLDFFLNNQQDTLIIQIYFVIKLYMFRAWKLPVPNIQ